MADLPSGIVTFLFTDIEASTGHLERLGAGYAEVLDEVRRILRAAVGEAGGKEVDCRADELFAAFPHADDAVRAALGAQTALATQQWPGDVPVRVRMGLHTGEPVLRDDGYLGLDVHRASRICAAAHGGQILISQATFEFLPGGIETIDLGEHTLRGITRPERLHQPVATGLRREFPHVRVAPDSVFAGDERSLGAAVRREVSGSRRLREALARSHEDSRGLAELGWEVRAQLPKAQPAVRESLAQLGGELFTAARSLVDAERYLEQIDDKGLEARLREYRDLAVVSRAAQRESESHERALRDLDALQRSCERARAASGEIAAAIDRLDGRAEAVAVVRDDVRALSSELDASLTRVQNDETPTALRLHRTRFRGVYRLGSRYVVPYEDSLGIERRRLFETAAQARDFRRAVKAAENAQSDIPDHVHLVTGEDTRGWGAGGDS